MQEKTAEIKRLDVRFVSMLCPRRYSCLEPRYLCGVGGESGKGGRKFYPLVLLFRNVPIGNDGASSTRLRSVFVLTTVTKINSTKPNS